MQRTINRTLNKFKKTKLKEKTRQTIKLLLIFMVVAGLIILLLEGFEGILKRMAYTFFGVALFHILLIILGVYCGVKLINN